MKLSLSEKGGWPAGAAPRKKVIDLSSLDESRASEGRELIERLMASETRSRSANERARDAVEYTIDIEHEGQSTSYASDSTSLTSEFAALLKWLKVELASRRKQGKEDG